MATPDANAGAAQPLIEIGWVLAGPLEEIDRQSVQRARHSVETWLETTFPSFEWRMPIMLRREVLSRDRLDPVALLDIGVIERDLKKWDFAFVLTASDLASYYKPYTFGAPSQALSAAVLSTARLDPRATLSAVDDEERRTVLARRLHALALHLLGHLNGLPHQLDPADYMFDLNTAEDLDRMHRLDADAESLLREELSEEADPRLEEKMQKVRQRWLFYLRAAWLNRDDIWGAVLNLRPWQFPFRFSRLTTAAASTLLVLITTAEAWDLGTSQSPLLVTGLSVVTLVGTSSYILDQQQLLERRLRDRPSEQRVVTRLSIVCAVAIGMMTTYLLLFLGTLALAFTFFNVELIQSWISTDGLPVDQTRYFLLAGFVASLGIVIGAMGASFEEQTYFRHVAFVNEET